MIPILEFEDALCNQFYRSASESVQEYKWMIQQDFYGNLLWTAHWKLDIRLLEFRGAQSTIDRSNRRSVYSTTLELGWMQTGLSPIFGYYYATGP